MFVAPCVIWLLAGCATGDEATVGAGSPYPSWCEEIIRQQREMPSPRTGDKDWPRLPDECVEKVGVQLFPRVPPPLPKP
jgi:hypothetical protein